MLTFYYTKNNLRISIDSMLIARNKRLAVSISTDSCFWLLLMQVYKTSRIRKLGEKVSVRILYWVGTSHRGHSLSSRWRYPRYQSTLERDARLTKPLLVFVSIKGKEEAFLLRERMASEILHPVAQCCTFTEEQQAELKSSELCCRSHELNQPFLRENRQPYKAIVSFSPHLSVSTTPSRSPSHCLNTRFAEKMQALFLIIVRY